MLAAFKHGGANLVASKVRYVILATFECRALVLAMIRVDRVVLIAFVNRGVVLCQQEDTPATTSRTTPSTSNAARTRPCCHSSCI